MKRAEKSSEAAACSRSLHPVVGQGFEEEVESLSKQFKYVISGLIAIGGNMRRFTQVNRNDASFKSIVESFKTLGPQVASDLYDRKEYDKYFDEMEANAKQEREHLIRSAFVLGFICTMEGFNSECTGEPPKTLFQVPYYGIEKRDLTAEIESCAKDEKLANLMQEAVAHLSNVTGQRTRHLVAGTLDPLVGRDYHFYQHAHPPHCCS